MIQDIRDRVPVNVLSNNAIRYGVYDEQGKFLRYEYIKREDEAVEEGTPINRALLSNIQGDLYAADRYNIPTVVKGQVSSDGVKIVGNAFPNTWTRVSATEYTAENGDILTASSSVESTSNYRLNYVIDGGFSGSWQSEVVSTVGENEQWIKIKLKKPLKIKKMATYVSKASNYFTFTSAIIQGSNDNEIWDDLYTILNVQTELKEVTLENDNYYEYYRIYLTGTTTSANNGSFMVYEWQTVEYMTKEDQIIYNINLPLTSYEVGKIVNIEGVNYEDITSFENTYLNINNLGAKLINGTINAGEKYNLIYNGESWDIIQATNVISGIYSGTGDSVTIDVGFKPRAVFVYPACTVNTAYTYQYQGVASEKGNSPNIEITNTGFIAKNTREWSIATKTYTYQYVAFK